MRKATNEQMRQTNKNSDSRWSSEGVKGQGGQIYGDGRRSDLG